MLPEGLFYTPQDRQGPLFYFIYYFYSLIIIILKGQVRRNEVGRGRGKKINKIK